MKTDGSKGRKLRPHILPKLRAALQQQINSKCPFCSNEDVGHFEIHHIDENPSNNTNENLLMLCRICHSKITKGDISYDDVLLVKRLIMTIGSPSRIKISIHDISESEFKIELKEILSDTSSSFYSELRAHWNTYSLLESTPLLNFLIRKNLNACIDNGILLIVSDFVSKHIQNDREAKYLYNQRHIHTHDTEDEGFDLPVYYFIKFIGLIYSTSIISKVDIASLSDRHSNMQSIYSEMIRLMCLNFEYIGLDSEEEYPTNYHWLIAEVFNIMNDWLVKFNDVDNFQVESSYVDFIPFSMGLCFKEIYKAVKAGTLSLNYLTGLLHYNLFIFYFSRNVHEHLRKKIEEEIIRQIPAEYLYPVLEFSLDESFAINITKFESGDFGYSNEIEKVNLSRLREVTFNSGISFGDS